MKHPLAAYRERREPQMTQEELGALLGVDRITIHRWESGKRKPRPADLARIQERTGIAPRELRPDLADLMDANESENAA